MKVETNDNPVVTSTSSPPKNTQVHEVKHTVIDTWLLTGIS